MNRYIRPSLRYVDEGARRRRLWFYLTSGVLLALMILWVVAPTVVLAILGLAVFGVGIALHLKVRDLRVQRRANEAAAELDRRLKRARWVTAVEHETEIAPLGADPTHCDDCQRVHHAREQRSIHELATTLGEKCECDVCTNKPWRLRGACAHLPEHRSDAYDILNEDGVLVHVGQYCRSCGYTIPDDDDDEV